MNACARNCASWACCGRDFFPGTVSRKKFIGLSMRRGKPLLPNTALAIATPIRPEDRRLRLSRGLNSVAVVIAALMMLTSSCDVFLVVQAGGTFRFCQMIALVLIAL